MRLQTANRQKIAELHKEAEWVADSKAGKEEARTLEDALRLIHELRVHQNELELQNEKLRRAQEGFEDSRRQNADMFELAPIGYLTLDENGVILAANLEAARQLGTERRHLIKKSLQVYIDEEHRDLFYMHLRKVIRDGERHSCELKLAASDGGEHYVQADSTPIMDSMGNTLCINSIVDITGHKRREAQIAFQASLLDQVRNAVIATDLNGKIEYWNNFAETLYQWKANEVVGKHILDVIVSEENRKHADELFENIKESGSHKGEFVLRRKDASIFPAFFCVSSITDAHKLTTGFVGVIADITEHKRAEEQLQLKTAHLEEVNAALKILLRHRDEEKGELQAGVLSNVKHLILPYLDKLKQSRLDHDQMTYIGILESHIREIIGPFTKKLCQDFCNLSSMEIQVADLVKAGKTNKEIADLLHLSKNTILTHRYRLRNKLGLRNSKTNLRSHLQSLE
jgi:PAS domain S-box-containing protein